MPAKVGYCYVMFAVSSSKRWSRELFYSSECVVNMPLVCQEAYLGIAETLVSYAVSSGNIVLQHC